MSSNVPDLLDPSERLVVAMSGGVDSTVAAHMLHEAGHPLVGLFMRNGVDAEESEKAKKSCCSVGDARDARMVASGLGIPFQAVDLKREFGRVIQYFLAEYGRGRTPNPCAICNRDLKFHRLLAFADELGAAGVATGHYAQLEIAAGRPIVRRGVDHTKDQSYQLFCVAEADLLRTRLPLGGLRKSEVRALAAERGLRTASKPDSQEICFVPKGDYRELLDSQTVHPGDLVDTHGHVLGQHPGTEYFTIGQRRGLGVAAGRPLYVVEILPERGVVVLGDVEDCHSSRCEVDEVNLIGFDAPDSGSFRADVQVRYHHDAAPANIELDGTRARVVFDEPQLAVAPGQGAAFYRADRLLGGGWIASTESRPSNALETVRA